MKQKITIILLTSLLIACASCGPDPKEILLKSLEKCESIENGSYEATKHLRFPPESDSDTVVIVRQSCSFKKLEGDNNYTFAFNEKLYLNGSSGINLMYNGEEMLEIDLKYATIIPALDTLLINERFLKNAIYSPYGPITRVDCQPLPSRQMLKSNDVKVIFEGDDTIDGTPCYKIKVVTAKRHDGAKVRELEHMFWISKSDYLPIKFYSLHKISSDGDTIEFCDESLLTDYKFNIPLDDSIFTRKILPENAVIYDVKKLGPHDPPAVGTNAPDFKLETLTGNIVTLSQLKGNPVLLEFFDISISVASVYTIPTLNSLQERYEKSGLKVYGVNLLDYNKKDVQNFIEKYGVRYPTLLDTDEVHNIYKIRAFPTIYLIGKDGKIVYHSEGLDEKELEEAIESHIR